MPAHMGNGRSRGPAAGRPLARCGTIPHHDQQRRRSAAQGGAAMMADYAYTISYGKLAVPFYRVYAPPLSGLRPGPGAAFTGRANVLFAAQGDVAGFCEDFLAASTE